MKSIESITKSGENLIVYESLRSTVLHCEDGIRNARIYMYTVYFALAAFGLKLDLTLFISFFVLIVFQTMINSDKIAIDRVAAYIKVFFEDKRNDIHWSSLNKDVDHLTVYYAQCRNLGWYINYAGSSILAFLSLTIIVSSSFTQSTNEINMETLPWGKFILAFILFCLVVFINLQATTGGKKDQGKLKAINNSIEIFYKKCYPITNNNKFTEDMRNESIE